MRKSFNGYTIVTMQSTGRQSGLGFIVRNRLIQYIRVKRCTDRIATLKLNQGHNKFAIINVHASASKTVAEASDFVSELNQVYHQFSFESIRIVSGDFNAIFGTDIPITAAIGINRHNKRSNANARAFHEFVKANRITF